MGRFKRYNLETYVSVNKDGLAKCLVCDKVIKAHMGNIKRHYATIHKQELNSPDEENIPPTLSSSPSSSKKRKVQTIRLQMDKEQFIKCIGKTVTEMHMPFSYFDNKEFQNLLQPWTDVYGIKYNSKSIGVLVNEMANSLRSEITLSVNKKYICLKLDIASRMDRSIMGVNIQYINQNFEIVVYTIGMIELLERHFALYLKQQVLNILERFDININQVYSVTTDNGANVIKTSKLLQEYSANEIDNDDNFDDQLFDNVSEGISDSLSVVHCAAHTLQLAAWDVLKQLKDEVNRCRDAVKFIRKKMRELKASPVPLLDNTTRWSSTFEMVQSLIEAKVWIESNNTFSVDVDWEFATKFMESFKPVSDATTMLQYKQLVMGDFYREWLVAETELEDMSSSNPIAKLLLEALKRRKEILVNNNAFIAALYIDQRFCFKSSRYLNDDQKKIAIVSMD